MPRFFPLFKYTVYTLLALSIAMFFIHRTVHEGLDSLGWVGLLALFEWQSRRDDALPAVAWERWVLIAGQCVFYGLILYALANFYLNAQWLDIINASLWLLVVITICIDLYGTRVGKWRMRYLHHATKFILYAALFAVAVIWGMTGDWLNFYDATLWIICFFAIELNLLQRAHAYYKNEARE